MSLGPARATPWCAASVLRRGIPLSFHCDVPMGPAAPLTPAWCGVNRITPSGRVAGPEQRISVHDALRAVTIEAAYLWRMEDELGRITPGKSRRTSRCWPRTPTPSNRRGSAKSPCWGRCTRDAYSRGRARSR